MRPQTRLSDSIQSVSSEVLVTPSGIAPAATSRSTAVAERSATSSRRATEPEVWGIPATANDSLIVQGTPSSGGGSLRPRREPSSRSASSASARAASKRVATSALTAAFRSSIRAMWASTTSRAVSLRSRIAAASSSAERSVRWSERGGAATAGTVGQPSAGSARRG